MAETKRRLPAPLYQVQKKLRAPSVPAMPPSEADHAARSDADSEAAWEAYLIPGEDHVLRNKLGRSWAEPYGITNKDELTRLEERFTAFRMIELQQRPIQGDFTLRHMKAIHGHLFQDVYDWAGEHRNVDMAKEGHTHMAYFQIERLWGKVSDYVEKHNRFQDIQDPAEFADKLAFVWGRVNAIHAFREGNTRSQVLFFDQLCSQAGFELDVARLSPEHPDSVREEFVAARFHHQDHEFDHEPLAAVLRKIVRPAASSLELEQRLERAAAPQSQWSPEARHRAEPVVRSEYENPDKLRTAHRRPEIQEDTMANDPTNDPRFPAANRPGSMTRAVQAQAAAEREKAERRVPVQPHEPIPPRPGMMRLNRVIEGRPRSGMTPPPGPTPIVEAWVQPASTAHTIPPMPEGSLAPGQTENIADEYLGAETPTPSHQHHPRPRHEVKGPDDLARRKAKYAHLFRDDEQQNQADSGFEL